MDPPAADATQSAGATAGRSQPRRDLLTDQQWRLDDAGVAQFVRWRSVALDAGNLKDIAEPQIVFNPDYQSVSIHSVAITRDGARTDRTARTKIETLRREQNLERQIIDGYKTLLLIIDDVRIGDEVEIAYTVHGQNPIFDNRFAALMHFSGQEAVELVHMRLDAPASRQLRTRSVGMDIPVTSTLSGDRRILQAVLRRLPATVAEQGTPPWFKVFPALEVSEYTDWPEVSAWAGRLFAVPAASADIAALADTFRQRNLTPRQTVDAVLAFVQDEIRYFSISLGESSHRPKAPAQTLAQRIGDCKDKVVLFNAILAELGIQARPALVSVARGKAIVDYLPGPAAFDHVVSRVTLDGQDFLLDPTLAGQGSELATRGYPDYGAIFVVGADQPPVPYEPPAATLDQAQVTQSWDFSDLRRGAAPMQLVFRVQGLTAESWRNGMRSGGLERWAQSVGGNYMRVYPGLKVTGAPSLSDDRRANVIEVTLPFEHEGVLDYRRGAVQFEYSPLDLTPYLAPPPEARRRMPYWLDMPRAVESIVRIRTPRPSPLETPAARQLGDRHLAVSSRYVNQPGQLEYVARLERKAKEVLPADMPAFRERMTETRRQLYQSIWLPLIDTRALESDFRDIDRRMVKYRRREPDQLFRILINEEISALFATESLKQVKADGPQAAAILATRAQSLNHIGRFFDALIDADAALRIQPDLPDALSARGVALVGLDRLDDAAKAFSDLQKVDNSGSPDYWLGITHYYRGQFEQAERVFADVAAASGSVSSEFARAWWYIAAERREAGRAARVIPARDLEESADAKLPRAILRMLAGRINEDALVKLARESANMERLNLAEAYFFIGKSMVIKGQRKQALDWFRKATEQQAIPYREHTLSQLEIKRGE